MKVSFSNHTASHFYFTTVGAGSFIDHLMRQFVMSFENNLKPALFASIAVNVYNAFTNIFYCWVARAGLVSLINTLLNDLKFNLQSEPAPTSVNTQCLFRVDL